MYGIHPETFDTRAQGILPTRWLLLHLEKQLGTLEGSGEQYCNPSVLQLSIGGRNCQTFSTLKPQCLTSSVLADGCKHRAKWGCGSHEEEEAQEEGDTENRWLDKWCEASPWISVLKIKV